MEPYEYHYANASITKYHRSLCYDVHTTTESKQKNQTEVGKASTHS